MINKKVVTGTLARDRVIKGANFLADAVKSTLGPYGMNAAIEKGDRITNDGVTIAREISLQDEIEDRGVAILREAAIKTNDEAGDGTTTAITLAQAILKEAIKQLPQDITVQGKKTPIEVIKTIEKEKLEILKKLEAMSQPIETEDDLVASARVSVEDEELASLIGHAQWKLGKDGVILAEECMEFNSSVQYIKGIKIDNGLGTSIIMNNQEKQSFEGNDFRIILTNHIVQGLFPIKPVMDQLGKAGVKGLIIVARAFSQEAIKHCLLNIEAGFTIIPLNAPFEDQSEIMKDLTASLGGRYINTEDSNLEDIQMSDVGYVKKIIARRYDAVFTAEEDEKSMERIEKRVAELKEKLKGEVSAFEKKNIERRISQLTNGFALLRIGATSGVQRKYLKDKADDAVNAVKAAFQEGVVPGAGLAFKEIADTLPDTYLLKRPLYSIYEQIRSTSGAEFEVPSWVRDPVKVLRVALEKACSVAGTLATINIAIAVEREKPRFMQEVPKTNEQEIYESR